MSRMSPKIYGVIDSDKPFSNIVKSNILNTDYFTYLHVKLVENIA